MTHVLHSVIVDDEVQSRFVVRKMLEMYCPQVSVVGEAANIEEAYALIQEHQPDLVFLDVEMPHGSGFELLKKFSYVPFDVIFVTGFDQYALQAIKFCALDYLLKPINANEFIVAVNRCFAKKQQTPATDDRLRHLMENIRTQQLVSHKIALATAQGIEFMEVGNIIHCEAEGNYTVIYLTDKSRCVATGKIKEFEELLQGYSFVRVHKSHLINVQYIRKFLKKEGGYFVMQDNQEIPVARRKKEEVMKILSTGFQSHLLIA